MPWWSWILLWAGLVLALLGMLAWFGYALFRKAVRTMEALEGLADQFAGLELDPQLPPLRPFRPAVFEETADVRLALEQGSAERRHRRQLRWDRLVVRGKLMQHAPSTQRTDSHA
ncbi:hypothetical protein [Cryobacterium fucosi]|uniref:Uncharacterized protein n=1 Tax=Cryobacterium fucosi TaxID=1259157 RepID=A0A4R9B0V6_9MICO|nr:hypothetical protein [Cryobacterium fucosi]TFD73030.1 hypothetical protein E3T48_14980 [Cryobacterium fucosi]